MNDAAQRRLLDRLRPDTSRTGRVRRLLATTHNLQADFFDGDFLCTALSIAQADFAGHSGQIALQRKLAGLDYSGVLCEASAYEQRPSLRTVVHPVTVRGACLHAKLVVVEYDHAVRVLVGSANLTSTGYRENREVLGEHLAHENEPKRAAQAAAILRAALEVLATFAERAPGFLAELSLVLQRLESWAPSAPAEVSPVVWSDGARSLWRTVLERWPAGTRVERVLIVSPFWSEDGSRDTPLRRLLAELRARDALSDRCAVELYVESAPLADGSFVPKALPAIYYADFPGVSVRVLPVDPKIAVTDLDVKVELKAARTLHAKVLVLQSRERALAYAGSANFTRNGFGLRHAAPDLDRVLANIEAGWLFELAPAAVAGLLPPAANAGQEIRSLAEPSAAPREKEEDEDPGFWPDALLAAELTPAADTDVLGLTTTWSAATPSGWTVHVATGDQELGPALLSTLGGAATIATALSAAALQLILRNRHVVVATPNGQAAFPVNVAAGDARDRLPVSPAGIGPGESDLLAYYQGRLTFDDLYPDGEGGTGKEPPSGDTRRNEQAVDKSRIQAYQIRAFVDALPGIERELRAATGSRGVLYQAFLGEVSPVALSRHVFEQVESGGRSVTAGAFQLVELAAMLRSVAGQPQPVEYFVDTCHQARQEVEKRLAALQSKHTRELSPSSAFARYAQTLQGG
jgi:hypothetical protein